MDADYSIREMTIEDYDHVYALWLQTPGLKLDETDGKELMRRYLQRNPRLNYVAVHSGAIIGTVKCGHDGRRGYLYHLVVAPVYQKRGISKALYERCLAELGVQGITRCILYVLAINPSSKEYWKYNGWQVIDQDFQMMQRVITP